MTVFEWMFSDGFAGRAALVLLVVKGLFRMAASLAYGYHVLLKSLRSCHCLKSVRIWSFPGPYFFSRIRTEYREIQSIFPYSVRMRENTDQKISEYGHFSRSVWHVEQLRKPSRHSTACLRERKEKIYNDLPCALFNLLILQNLWRCSFLASPIVTTLKKLVNNY